MFENLNYLYNYTVIKFYNNMIDRFGVKPNLIYGSCNNRKILKHTYIY